MNVSLTKELEQLVNDRVQSGMYQTASEVIREGLRLLKARDNAQSLARDVRAGFAAVEAGDYADYTARTTSKLAGDIKMRGRKRLTSTRKKSSSA
jgi:antitoxin ParD1/3/4